MSGKQYWVAHWFETVYVAVRVLCVCVFFFFSGGGLLHKVCILYTQSPSLVRTVRTWMGPVATVFHRQ